MRGNIAGFNAAMEQTYELICLSLVNYSASKGHGLHYMPVWQQICGFHAVHLSLSLESVAGITLALQYLCRRLLLYPSGAVNITHFVR